MPPDTALIVDDNKAQRQFSTPAALSAKLVVNPVAHQGQAGEELFDRIVKRLRNWNILAEVLRTSADVEQTRADVTAAVKQGYDLIIAAGGDGTVETVACCLLHTPVPLGIIPLGTYNNLARTIGIPSGIDDACEVIGTGMTRAIDVGCVGDTYFFEVAGVGLVAELFPSGELIKGGNWEAILTALTTVISYPASQIMLVLDGGAPITLDSLMVTVANSSFFGAGFEVAPDARLTDNAFNVYTYEGMSKLDILDYYRRIATTAVQPGDGLKCLQASKVTVDSPLPLKVHADDHLLGTVPVMFESVPAALRLRVPRHGQENR